MRSRCTFPRLRAKLESAGVRILTPCAALAIRGKPTMPEAAEPPGIRRRLLLFLVPLLLLVVICAGALTYRVALSVATSAYDRGLLDPALDLIANSSTWVPTGRS